MMLPKLETTKLKRGRAWIIGYGNPQRRDDGIGHSVIRQLREAPGSREDITLLDLHQLQPELAEELQEASLIIVVDATVEALPEGREWLQIRPKNEGLPQLTHHCTPAYLLALLDSLYGAAPAMWQVSVEGDDFDFGEGLSTSAEARATRVVREICTVLGQ